MQNYQQVQPTHPGYIATVAPAPMPQQPTFVTQTVVSSSTDNSGGGMKSAIPDLPFVLALIYGILNFFFPGVGTILAGISVLFCGSIRQSGGEKVGVFCTNVWVGILQAILAVFLVGWIWSVIWGIAIISVSGSSAPSTQNQTSTVVISQQPNQQALPQPQMLMPSYPQTVPPPQPQAPMPPHPSAIPTQAPPPPVAATQAW